jgi:hypothetical protein
VLPALILFAVVGSVILLAVLFAKDPPPEGTDASNQLDRFLAEARGDRHNREPAPAPRTIPTARPRQRPRVQPTPRTPESPTPQPVTDPVVIIRRAAEPPPTPAVDPTSETPIVVPPTERRTGSPAAQRLVKLLSDRDTLKAAFLLNEVLRPPKSRQRTR